VLLSMTEQASTGHVFTLHAELEGGAYLPLFSNLLTGWRAQGYTVSDMPAYMAAFPVEGLPVHAIIQGSVPGRSGVLAVQGAAIRDPR
jgi:hypothetical protein